MNSETPIVKELRDQAAIETKADENPFEARKQRVEWRAADEIERLIRSEDNAAPLNLPSAVGPFLEFYVTLPDGRVMRALDDGKGNVQLGSVMINDGGSNGDKAQNS